MAKRQRLVIKPAGLTREQRAQFTLFKGVIASQADSVRRLNEALASQKNLVQNISHELKNPLTVLYGYTSLLLGKTADLPPQAASQLRAMERNLQVLSGLIEELLEGARLDAGKVALDREALSAEKLAADALADMRFEATKKEVRLTLDAGSATGLKVYADARRARQILLNLLGNAIKFTPEGGAVILSVKKDEGFACFHVRDSGVGLAPNSVYRLFERFYQAEETGHASGLGLGLSISKSLVELHGGKIWAENEDRGASFYFTLPQATMPKATKPVSAGKGSRRSSPARLESETCAAAPSGTPAKPG